MDRRELLALGGAAGAAWALAGATTAHAQPTSAPDATGYSLVTEQRSDGRYGIAVTDATGTVVARQTAPIQVSVKVGDFPVDCSTGYATVSSQADGLYASGTVTTPAGSGYRFDDVYAADGTSVLLSRAVTVDTANDLREMAFCSRFALGPVRGGDLTSYDVFYPGMWYGDATGLPSGAVGADYSKTYFYVREMRLALPFVALRDRTGGGVLTLAREAPKPATSHDGFVPEPSDQWWVDDSIAFAGLGVHRSPAVELAVTYPGQEGETSYISGSWARRGHPVRVGFSHSYQVRLAFGSYPDLPSAARWAWRYHWDRLTPAPGTSPAADVFTAGTGLLQGLVRPYNGYPGLPFRAQLHSGLPDAISYMMGFVGQQAPAGYQLLRAGMAQGDAALTALGRSILDFWVGQSPLANGLPKLWIDGDQPNWRTWYPAYLRVCSDGMDGVLDAARLMRRSGTPVTAWETYLVNFGNFLVSHQGPDGSFPRAFNWDGTVNDATKTNTSHPIRFLTNLHLLTGDGRYLTAATRAGGFYRAATRGTFRYVGGTADNPNILDKEGGGLALHAFLALYDATGDASWLTDAQQAADYTETWLVAWGYGIDTPRAAYATDGPLGLSLIGAGGSGVDNWITYEGANFYRLYLFTGDAHYLTVASHLTSTAYRTTQYTGQNLGYGRDGLVEEATTLADLTYTGVGTWLPWSTVAQLEPLARLEDIFGSMDLATIEQLPLAERQRRNNAAGSTL
jgi:hypothetical protein